MKTDAEYSAWLQDASRNAHRVLLVELDHADGTVRVASAPWIDPDSPHNIFDDWLIGSPAFEDSLENFSGAGDVGAINASGDIDWLSLSFAGHECRWYHGDEVWSKGDFRRLTTTLISGIRSTGPRTYEWDLLDSGQQFRRTWLSADRYTTHSWRSEMNIILSDIGYNSIDFYNVPDSTRGFRIETTFPSDTTVESAFRRLVDDTAGAFMRMSQSNRVEVFLPDIESGPVLVVTDDDIIEGSVSAIETVRPYKFVRIDMTSNGPVIGSNSADTGVLGDEIVYDTILRRTSDANILLSEKLDYHKSPHTTWSIDLLDISGLLQVGDYIRIEHEQLTDNGIVSYLKRSPLDTFSRMEIIV